MSISKVVLRGITKSFYDTYDSISVLNNIDFIFEKGNFYLINGLSGSGKTTLFNIIGTLDKPNQHKNKFERGSFFRNKIKLEYVREQIKLHRLNDISEDLDLFSKNKDGEWEQLYKILNSLILKKNRTIYEHYHTNKPKICILQKRKNELNYLRTKYDSLDAKEKKKVSLIILESIFYPFLNIDTENEKYIFSKKSLNEKMTYTNLLLKFQSLDLNNDLKIDHKISADENKTQKDLIYFFNRTLISYKSNILFKYYQKRKDSFEILEEDYTEFNDLIKRFNSLKTEKKERVNRLILETIFYPMFVQSPDYIEVNYYVDDKDKERKFFQWSYPTNPISTNLTKLRKNYLRIIYQDFRLIECFSALDNILLTNELSEEEYKKLYDLIISLFEERESDEINILKRIKKENGNITYRELFNKTKKEIHRKSRDIMALSGGQKQLIGLIRAAGKKEVEGKVFLADEPTGQMDRELKEVIYEFLFELSKNNIVIVVSHEEKKSLKVLNNKNIKNLLLIDGNLF